MSVLELLTSMEIEGVGQEIVSSVVLIGCYSVILLLTYMAWKSTARRPLDYEVFLVEMHTLANRRVVEVLHLSNVFRPHDSYSRLLSRVRDRVRNRQERDGQWIRVSDTNVVIRSPSTVGRTDFPSSASTEVTQEEPLTLFEIELPATDSSVQNDQSHDSQVAAAAAIAVLGRGDGSEQRVTVQAIEARPELNFSDLHHLSMNLLVPSRRGVLQLPSMRVSASLFTRENVAPVTVESMITTNRYPSTAPPETPEVEEAESSSSEEPESISPIPTTPIETEINESLASETEVPADPETSPNPPIPETSQSELALIRLKFLDDTLIETRTSLNVTIAQFRQTNFATAVADNKVIRLIFQGQLLRDDIRTLNSYGIQDGSVIHCNISDTPYARPILTENSINQFESSVDGHTSSSAQLPHMPRMTSNNEADDNTSISASRLFTDILSTGFTSVPPSFILWIHNSLRSVEPVIRPSGAPNFWAQTYQTLYNQYLRPIIPSDENPHIMEAIARAIASRPQTRFCIGDYLVLIFGVQCALIWAYVYFFPQLCDRTAIGLLVLLTLYFVFVVLRNSDPVAQNRARANQRS